LTNRGLVDALKQPYAKNAFDGRALPSVLGSSRHPVQRKDTIMCEKIEVEGNEQARPGHGAGDREGDPLFPLMPKVIEALRAKAMERAKKEGGAEKNLALDEYAALIESICGATDDSQPVEQYDGTLGVTQAFVNANQRAVGQIQWNANLAAIYANPGNVSGARWCSGTLITNDLFLTAGHCFDQTGGGWQRPRVNGTTNIIPPSEIATNMHVNFNYQVDPAGNPRPVSEYPITALLEYRLGGLDFAIVRLGGNPGATWGNTPIATTDAATGDMLCIMGHPAGVPKRIEAGPALAPSGNRIRYDDIDTLGGNSGSGVLRASDGRIVGVHTNGGCGPSSPDGTNANFGVRIAALIAASPTLQGLTRPSLKFIDDGGSIKAIDDGVTLKFIDDGGSIKVLDDGGTIKAIDDGVGTLKGLDDVNTNPVIDQIGTRKGLDDAKSPALDKGFSDNKRPGFDGFPGFDPGRPVVNPGGLARPFALANPHHTMAWSGEQAANAAMDAYQARLAQLTEAIMQQQQVLAALDAEYREVMAELRQMGGG
jgi:V8-like Glu-specific endopeptidase